MINIIIQTLKMKKNKIILILFQFTIAFTALIFSISLLDNLLQRKKQVAILCDLNTVQIEVFQENIEGNMQEDLGKYERIISKIAEKKLVDKIGVFEKEYLWKSNVKQLDSSVTAIMVNSDLLSMTKFKFKTGSLNIILNYTGEENAIPIVISESISKNYIMNGEYKFYVDAEPEYRTFKVVGILKEPIYYWSGGSSEITSCVGYNDKFIIMPKFKEYQSNIPYEYNTLVTIPDTKNREEVLNEIKNRYLEEGISVGFDTMKEEIATFYERQKNVVIATLSFSVIILVLSALGCMGSILSNIITRKKEFGIYFTLGASKFHLYILVIGEILALLFISYFLSGGLSSFILYVCMKGEALYISWTNMITVFGVMLICTVCTSIIPAKKMSKLDPIKLLNERGN